MQLVLQHCCKTSGEAILRVLPPTFKPVKQQIRLLISLNESGKTHNIRFSTRFAAMLQNKLHIFVACFKGAVSRQSSSFCLILRITRPQSLWMKLPAAGTNFEKLLG